MSTISSNFNSSASYQNLLILFWFWISASLDAEEREEKAKRKRISRRVAHNQNIRRPQPLAARFP